MLSEIVSREPGVGVVLGYGKSVIKIETNLNVVILGSGRRIKKRSGEGLAALFYNIYPSDDGRLVNSISLKDDLDIGVVNVRAAKASYLGDIVQEANGEIVKCRNLL